MVAKKKVCSLFVVINVGISLAFPQNNQPISVLPNNAIPHSGFVGGFDTVSGGLANLGNGLGSGLDAITSGIFTGIANVISGVLGSGAISSAFLNYNNRLPVEAM